MRKQKKGISPLIATVLLIGFTIILAAVVIKWGGQLIEGLRKETDCSSIVSLQCAQNVDVRVTNVAASATDIAIVVDNRGKQKIDGFFFRLIYDTGKVDAIKLEQGLDSFSGKTFTLTSAEGYGGDTGLTKVEAIPSIATVGTDGTECKRDCTEKTTSFTIPIP